MQFDKQDTDGVTLELKYPNSCCFVCNKLSCRLRFDIAVRSPSQRSSSVKFMYMMWHTFNIQIKFLPVYYFCKCTPVVHIPHREWLRRHIRAMAEIHFINSKTKWQCAI